LDGPTEDLSPSQVIGNEGGALEETLVDPKRDPVALVVETRVGEEHERDHLTKREIESESKREPRDDLVR
jgi:hypothetical protein